MKHFLIFLLGLLCLLFDFVRSQAFESLKDPDVLYFEGKASEFPVVKVDRLTPVFTDRDLRSLIQNIPGGTSIRVIGWHSQGWLIQMVEGPNSLEGWVSSDSVKNVSSEDLQKYKAKAERIKDVKEAIEDKKVIPGMSTEEVRRALGKPNQTSFRQDERGKTETWSYIRYENIPQTQMVRDAFGNLYQTTTMMRIPKGEIRVEFKDGKVTAYEEKK